MKYPTDCFGRVLDTPERLIEEIARYKRNLKTFRKFMEDDKKYWEYCAEDEDVEQVKKIYLSKVNVIEQELRNFDNISI